MRPSILRARLAGAVAFSCLVLPCAAQDNVLVYGNSIIQGDTTAYLADLVTESGRPTPNIFQFIGGNQTTTNFLSQQGLITSSLGAGETWKAVIVQGGTIETTFFMGNDPAIFHANMVALANVFFAHSPQGLFIGHETGADHPNSSRYPSWFPSAAAWLGLSQSAYEAAREAITAAHPASPAARTAAQGTVFASTAGYPLNLFTSDLHHHTQKGKILDAILHFQTIYGDSLCDLDLDFGAANPTPLVARLLADNITPQAWDRLAGFADRSLARGLRPFPGSDSDFQLRVSIDTTVTNLCTAFSATAGDTLQLRPFSPLGATSSGAAVVYIQTLPTGTLPLGGAFPGLQLERAALSVYLAVPDLNGGAYASTIPAGLAGNSFWLQAASRGPSGSSTYPLALSDAKHVAIQ